MQISMVYNRVQQRRGVGDSRAPCDEYVAACRQAQETGRKYRAAFGGVALIVFGAQNR
jgi:hypothetical protein